MVEAASALTAALDNSQKMANTPLFATVLDKLLGFKISEWNAQGETIKRQILDGYDDAKKKGLGMQYVAAFRENTNLVNIGAIAAHYIDSTKHSDITIENDVFWGLIEHAKEVTNEVMQDLIAKIIAGEYNRPGTYTMSTLHILKSLGKAELDILSEFCSFYLPDHGFLRDFWSLQKEAAKLRSELGVDYANFLELQNLGLIQAGDYTISVDISPGRIFRIYLPASQGYWILKSVEGREDWRFPSCNQLTLAGRAIVQHLDVKPNVSFLEWLEDYFQKMDFIIIQKSNNY